MTIGEFSSPIPSMKRRFQNLKTGPWGRPENTDFLMSTRNERRVFKHNSDMNDDDKKQPPKRRSKISYRIPSSREVEFDKLVKLSGLSMNGFITDCVFRRNRHNPATQRRLVQILDEAARIKSDISEQDLSSEDITCELKLIRTALMALLGRRS